MRVVIFRTGSLGDTLCAIPAFRLLRQNFPDDELVLLCDACPNRSVSASDVARPFGIFDAIKTYRARRGWRTTVDLARAVLGLRPRIVVILPQDSEEAEAVARKARFFRLLGVRDVRATQIHSKDGEGNQNEANRLISILNEVGVAGQKPAFEVPIDPKAEGVVRDALRKAGVDRDRRFIVFCGGGKSAVQRWPLDRYKAVLAELSSRLDQKVVAIGSAADIEAYRSAGLDAVPNITLLEPLADVSALLALFSRAIGYLGNDTGPAHACAAVGRPTAVIMSGRAAVGAWDPDIEPSLVIRSEAPCAGCEASSDVIQTHSCMLGLSTEEVSCAIIRFFQKVLTETRLAESRLQA